MILVVLFSNSFLSLFVFKLYNKSKYYQKEMYKSKLDPLGIKFYPTEAIQQNSWDKKRVVFFGDSRAYQWISPTNMEQFEFINRGIGGQTSIQALERMEQHVNPLQPDIIIIQVCVNDLKMIEAFPELQAILIENCKKNLSQIVSRSLDLGATVILSTIFPLGELPIQSKLFSSSDVMKGIDEVNLFIRSLEGDGVLVFDTGSVLTDEVGIVRKQYSQDFLHLNHRGYETLNSELVRILELRFSNNIKITELR